MRRLPTLGGVMSWEFKRRGKAINVQVTGRLTFNTNQLILNAVLAGHGLAWVPGYHLYYPSRHASPALALVVAALRSRVAS